MQNQIFQRPFVMLIGSCNPDCQRSPALIDQDMDLAALFGPIGRVIARVTATQGCRTRAAVHRLPLPQDPFATTVEIQHRTKDLLPDARSLPGLKAFMQNAAGNAKPTGMDRFPLTARPLNVPDTIQDRMVRFSGTPGTGQSGLFGKVLFRNAPQWARNTEKVRLLRFCGMLFHDVSRFGLVFDNLIYNRIRHFFQVLLILG